MVPSHAANNLSTKGSTHTHLCSTHTYAAHTLYSTHTMQHTHYAAHTLCSTHTYAAHTLCSTHTHQPAHRGHAPPSPARVNTAKKAEARKAAELMTTRRTGRPLMTPSGVPTAMYTASQSRQAVGVPREVEGGERHKETATEHAPEQVQILLQRRVCKCKC